MDEVRARQNHGHLIANHHIPGIISWYDSQTLTNLKPYLPAYLAMNFQKGTVATMFGFRKLANKSLKLAKEVSKAISAAFGDSTQL